MGERLCGAIHQAQWASQGGHADSHTRDLPAQVPTSLTLAGLRQILASQVARLNTICPLSHRTHCANSLGGFADRGTFFCAPVAFTRAGDSGPSAFGFCPIAPIGNFCRPDDLPAQPRAAKSLASCSQSLARLLTKVCCLPPCLEECQHSLSIGLNHSAKSRIVRSMRLPQRFAKIQSTWIACRDRIFTGAPSTVPAKRPCHLYQGSPTWFAASARLSAYGSTGRVPSKCPFSIHESHDDLVALRRRKSRSEPSTTESLRAIFPANNQ